MQFDWDSANLQHISEHNVSPVEAEEAVSNAALALDVYIRNGEERTRFVGATSTGRVLIVVVTERHNATRVVTAFRLTRPCGRFTQN